MPVSSPCRKRICRSALLVWILAAGCSRSPSDPRFFAPGEDFEPLPASSPGDWLAEHKERGQTFEQFLRAKPARPDGRRHVLYLQPVGEFRQGESPSLDLLRRFAAAFFAMD